MNRKRNRMKQCIARLTGAACIAGLLLALTGCTAGQLEDGNNFGTAREQAVSVTLLPPGAFDNYGETRAMSPAQENDIAKAVVLQFDVADRLVKWADAHVYIGKDGKPVLNVILKSSLDATQRYDLVVYANASVTAATFAPHAGKTKEQVRTALGSEAYPDSKWGSEPIPMWGQQLGMIITPQLNNFVMPLLRAFARIDIGVGHYDASTDSWGGLTTGANTFTLQEVYLLNVHASFYVSPAPANLGADGIVNAPTPGSGLLTKMFSYSEEIIDRRQLAASIYLPEMSNTTNIEGERTCLVIGGSYQGGGITYYRIDMIDDEGNPVDVLRNHRYRFSVTSVTAEGYARLEDALSNPPINGLGVELVPLDEGSSGDIIFDKGKYLSVSSSEVQIYADNRQERTVELVTVKTNFSADAPPHFGGKLPGVVRPDPVSGVEFPITATFAAGTPYGDYDYTITNGGLSKTIRVRLQPGVDVHFDKLPFGNIAGGAVISSDGITPGWISLSDEGAYNAAKQHQHIDANPNAEGKMYVHFDENIELKGVPRKAIVQFVRKDGSGMLRAFFEQPDPTGLVLGRFGGDAWYDLSHAFMYERQLVMEAVEEYAVDRVYDDGSTTVASSGMPFGFEKIWTRITDFAFGRLSTIAFAERGDAGTSPYAARYCYEKNRDPNDIRWYLPAQKQLLAMYVAQGGIGAPLGGDYYWSASEHAGDGNLCWAYSSDNEFGGAMNGDSKSKKFRIRCVRDIIRSTINAPEVSIVEGNVFISSVGMPASVVTDTPKARTTTATNTTAAGVGLGDIASQESNARVYKRFEVSKTDNSAGTTWREAVDLCSNLDQDGTGWRLPTQRELVLMYILRPGLDKQSGFSGFANAYYWSATQATYEFNSSIGTSSRCVFLGDGYFLSGMEKTNNALKVRCIRDIVP